MTDMAVNALVTLSAPHGVAGPDVVALIHFDADGVENELSQIIWRDGYRNVYATFRDQPSRHWGQLFADAKATLPNEIAYIAYEVEQSRPVEGYGIVWIGEMTLTAAEMGDGSRWDCDRAYSVNPSGRVARIDNLVTGATRPRRRRHARRRESESRFRRFHLVGQHSAGPVPQ
ncbi:hypothetical protein [Rhodococcus qingshengii]|uniref:hypothetical protein n=1 Tax=Rhodococcus qingshengii TaxID=334542 RepID=UPI003019D70D